MALDDTGELIETIEAGTELLAEHSRLARVVVEDVRKLDQALKRATNSNVDCKVLMPLVLAAFSLRYPRVDMGTPFWLSLAQFSFNSFVALNRRTHPTLLAETADRTPDAAR